MLPINSTLTFKLLSPQCFFVANFLFQNRMFPEFGVWILEKCRFDFDRSDIYEGWLIYRVVWPGLRGSGVIGCEGGGSRRCLAIGLLGGGGRRRVEYPLASQILELYRY